jgi:DNA-binding CsgD family transcriptional regulator/tetratricopeptide (TPR) repeat protein
MDLLERTTQLHALDSALAQAKAGEGCVALVYGEAGIGKTSLVEHFIKEHRVKWRILQGACDSLFTPRPLGPLHDIASQTQGQLPGLLEAESNRTSIFSACLNELQQQATILVIEDVHWADEATLDLLKYLGRRIRQTVSLMILTYRDDEIGTDHPLRILVGDLASSHALHRIPVSSLSKEAVHELAKNKKVDSIELHRLTNGNPFFVTEALAVESGIPETVRDAVIARAARVSPAARAVLETAAVIGARAEVWLLSRLAGAEFASVEECVARGMLQSQGEYYVFRHELAKHAILESISSQRRIALHRLALDVLSESPNARDDLARLANHAEGTNDASAVLEYAPAAARQASAASSHREAVAFYELAMRFADALPPPKYAGLLEEYGRELDYADRFNDQILVLERVIGVWHSLGNQLRMGVNLAALGSCLLNIRRVPEAEEASQRAIVLLEELPPGVELARAYMERCYIKMVLRDLEETVYWGEKAIELGERFEEAEIIARTSNYMGSALIGVDSRRGLELLERSLAVAREADLPYSVAGTLGNLGGMLLDNREVRLSNQYLAEAIAYASEHDDDYHSFESQAWQALAYTYLGRWGEAAEIARVALERLGNNIARAGAAFALARLGLRRGNAEAHRWVDMIFSLSIATDAPRFDCPRLVQAEAFWLVGDPASVLEETRAAYATAIEKGQSWIAGELAFWRWRAGEQAPPPAWIAKPFALQIAGDWHGAAEAWEERGHPYEQAMALMDGDEAAQLAALGIFERLGALPIIERLKRQMRAQGIRIPRGPRPATRENPFGLTAREMEVLGCLVEGQSNNAIAKRLDLSTRTVEHHIASILQKMGVGSRNEAVALALKGGLITPE